MLTRSGDTVRPLLAIAALLFVMQLAPTTSAYAAPVSLPAAQVSDFLNAVKSAVSGKSNKRRRRRARGSDRPVLAKPPVPPARRPGTAGRTASASLRTEPTDVANIAIPAKRQAPQKITRRPALIAALPKAQTTAETTTVAVPTRRPDQSRKQASINVAKAVGESPSDTASTDIPPPPTDWDAAEISAAYDRCDALLGQLTVDIEPVEPMRKGPCGTPGPVRLSALGESTSVAVRPAATLNCKTVAQIHKWLEHKVQPAAVKILQSRVVRIRNVSSYACRNRNNAKSGKLSEHALGNALDVAGFVLADGRKVSVLKDWGTVKRDETLTEDSAQSTSTAPIRTKRKKRRKTQLENLSRVVATAAVDNRVALPVFKGPVRRGVRLNRVPDPGGPAANAQPDAQPTEQEKPEPPRITAKSRFLKQVHADACGIFSTVLGPEANDAHRDHFHFDTAKRSYKAYCR